MALKENIKFKDEALEKILEGAEILNNAVSPTIGPRGRCIIVENPGGFPTLTKDGVSVARKVKLNDKFKKLGCDVIKEASEKTCSVVGDGTSSTILLAYNFLKEGIKLRNSGFSPTEIKKGMELATNYIVDELKKLSQPVKTNKEIEQVASISANNDRSIGKLISEAIQFSGTDGIVLVEKSNSFNSFLERIEGMRFSRGYLSPYFINNQAKGIVELKEPYVFISTKKLKFLEQMLSLLENVVKTERPILIVGEEIEGEFLHTLITNKLKGTLSSCAILAPGIGEHKLGILEDLAILTKGEVISDASGHTLETLPISSMGKCEKVIISRNETTIVGGKGDKGEINKRISDLKSQLDDPTLLEGERLIIQERLAKLSGGISLIKVGGNTEAEMSERYDRVEDALFACKAATAEGIVPGGGTALVRASNNIKIPKDKIKNRDIEAGVDIIKKSCSSLLKKIVENEGSNSPDIVLQKVLDMSDEDGFDASKNVYVNLIENGVIDPVLATRTALQNACSAASLLLVVDAAIIERENKEAEEHGVL